MSIDYHSILGVAKGASAEEIKKSFRRLAHEHHPDQGGNPKMFKKINDAYNAIMPKKNLPMVIQQEKKSIPSTHFDGRHTNTIETTEEKCLLAVEKREWTVRAEDELYAGIPAAITTLISAGSAGPFLGFSAGAVKTFFSCIAIAAIGISIHGGYKKIKKGITREGCVDLLKKGH